MLLLRFYLIILLSFFKQEIILPKEKLDMVELRDIRIKNERETIYNWNGDWVQEVIY
jgi:hypothetical protein